MTRAGQFFWIINPDAEVELQRISRGMNYAPGTQLLAAMASRRDDFLAVTLEDDWSFSHELPRCLRGIGLRPLYWCPTPRALHLGARAGYAIPRAPTCLARVHHKGFLQNAGLALLPGRTVVQDLRTFQSILAQVERSSEPGWTKPELRVKRPFGFAGRGQRTIGQIPRPGDERWLEESLRQGPLIIEPEVARPRLGSIHGVVGEDEILLGEPVFFDPDESLRRHSGAIAELGTGAARALSEEGYFGPFGLDVLLGPSAVYALDLNPRFTMRFSEGMGRKRTDALELCQHLAFG